MYSFSAIKNESELYGSSQVENLLLFSEYNEIQIQGRMKALFGEPLYETKNLEDAYAYVIQAMDESGAQVYFSVYQGGTGAAIGAKSRSEQLQEAVEAFKQVLCATQPVDFLYEGYYMDACVKVTQGIQSGQFTYEEEDLDDEEVKEMYKIFGFEM